MPVAAGSAIRMPAQFDASWEADLFGAKRRALEASTATAEAAEENLRDVQVSLLAEVVLNYIDIRFQPETDRYHPLNHHQPGGNLADYRLA